MSTGFTIIFLLLFLYAVKALHCIANDINSIKQDISNYYSYIIERDRK